MNLTVSKDQIDIGHIDLDKEVAGTDGPVSFFIGRSSDCHVHLDDKQISRQQAKLTFQQGLWTISNLSDLQPLLINGQSIRNGEINNGDVIQLAGYVISVALKEPSFGRRSTDNAEEEEIKEPSVSKKIVTESLPKIEEASSVENEFREFKPNPNEVEEEEEFVKEEPVTNEAQDDFAEEHQNSNSTFIEGENTEAEFPEADDNNFDLSESEDIQDEYASEGGDIEEYEDDSGDKTQLLQSFAKYQLEIFGEFAPYDKYIIEKNEVIVGRDPRVCDIVLNDSEVSSKHAKIIKSNIMLVLEDLQSGNGTLLNGSRVNRSNLAVNDEFIIGSTTFTVKVVSELLKEQNQRLMPVEENQEIEVEEVVEVETGFDDDEIALLEGESAPSGPQSKSLIAKFKNMDPDKRKKYLYGAVGLLALWVLLDEEKPPKPAVPANQETKEQSAPQKEEAVNKTERILKPEEIEFLDAQYQLANALFEQGKYAETNIELEKMFTVVPDYKNARQLYELSKTGLAKIEELERKRQEEIDRKIRLERVKGLVERAKEATKERRTEIAENLFNEILSLDPENYDVPQFRLELDAWRREEQRKKLEEEAKKAERRRMVDALEPGKSLYLKKDWYGAILRLEEFLAKSNMDEDLVKEGTSMLAESKRNLDGIVQPLLGRARSLSEGQDLKGAYENYGQVLRYEPTNTEAIREMADIREQLYLRAKRIYREAIIAESLSLFEAAKEKFQEVQQVSPSDSEYYEKATEKLKYYFD